MEENGAAKKDSQCGRIAAGTDFGAHHGSPQTVVFFLHHKIKVEKHDEEIFFIIS